MDDWEGLRAAAVVAVWLTIGGGVLMAVIWLVNGGTAAIGPEDEISHESGSTVRPRTRATSFSVVQLTTHALFGLLTAVLLTAGVSRNVDLTGGYVAVLGGLILTAGFGIAMFRKWRSGARPSVPAAERATERVEDRIPGVVAYAHGLAGVATVVLVVALLLVD